MSISESLAFACPLPQDRLTVTVDEAAKLLGIGRTLAYEAVRLGELPTIRIGRRILIPVAELARLAKAAG
jgi:excisionase family DNA binding protein